jgi:hypothetical protein
MAVSADGLRRLAALELTAEQLREVLSVVAESIEDPTETRGVNALRQARYRERKRNETVTPSVTERNETVTNVTLPRSPIRERVLNAIEEEDIKELPTVVRKPEAGADLFGSPSVRDKRRAKVEEETRIVRFACEGWNDMIGECPRMVRIAVVPDGGTRERAILKAAKSLMEDWDLPTPEAGFQALYSKIRASPFLQGNLPPGPGRDRAFKPTIDRILKLLNPIMEDTYGPEVQARPSGNGNGLLTHAYGR